MIDHCYYPFLTKALTHHITSFDKEAIIYTRNHIEKYTPTKILDMDLSVWLVGAIILRNLQNNYLTRKFVSNYGKLFESRFSKDVYNKEIRLEILDYFDIQTDIEFLKITREDYVRLHVVDYLHIQEKGLSVSAPQFNLINQTLSKGYNYIEFSRFVYYTRLALEQTLLIRIKAMKSYDGNDLINKYVDELKIKYPLYDKLQAPGKGNIPQSIQELIDIAYRDHHLNHRQRIKLGIYLQKNNFDMEYILDIFRQLSDWNEKVTRYQLKSLLRYIRPSN